MDGITLLGSYITKSLHIISSTVTKSFRPLKANLGDMHTIGKSLTTHFYQTDIIHWVLLYSQEALTAVIYSNLNQTVQLQSKVYY